MELGTPYLWRDQKGYDRSSLGNKKKDFSRIGTIFVQKDGRVNKINIKNNCFSID